MAEYVEDEAERRRSTEDEHDPAFMALLGEVFKRQQSAWSRREVPAAKSAYMRVRFPTPMSMQARAFAAGSDCVTCSFACSLTRWLLLARAEQCAGGADQNAHPEMTHTATAAGCTRCTAGGRTR
jgi:hypothetical protein